MSPRAQRLSVAGLLSGTFFGAMASMAQAVVLGKQIYDITGRQLDLGLLGLAEFAPAAVLVLVTGSVADRFDRRKVAAIGLVWEGMVALALAWYVGTRPTAPGPIFLLAMAFGAGRAFAAPASRSLPADIAPDRLPWLVPRMSASWQIALVVGPVLGGFLVARDAQLPYFVVAAFTGLAALSFLVVAAPPRGLPALAPEPEPLVEAGVEPSMGHAATVEARGTWREAIEGLVFIRRQPLLLGAISLDLFAVLFGGAIALLPAIAKDRLGVDAVGLGWLRAAGGIGAAVVTIWLALRPVRRKVGRVLLTVVALFGLGTIVLGLTTSFLVAFGAMAVLSGADAISVFIRATLVPLVTPGEKRGRVLAVENVFIGASNELGAFESGVAGQVIGTTGAVVLGGAATLVVAGAWWVLFPTLREVDQFPEADNAPV